ncbi:diuretic hormone 41 isoform X4 [Galleria mellonella]|uniref:DH34 n=1 Tax=Galleria mellonella TaxID=7137 RepID=A0A6J3CF82_GALME|nr:diuretic hormone 41 isoform X4 [Galleria mellonella]WLY76825.1 DH34 [Galleria mellonella]
MMWWALWCAVVVAGGVSAAAAPAPDSLSPLTPLDLVQIDPPAPDDEGVSYAMPAVGGRYAGAPWLYLLTEMPHESQVASNNVRLTRQRRDFSVNPPVDVLQRGVYNSLVERLVQNNRNFLNRVGKRASME